MKIELFMDYFTSELRNKCNWWETSHDEDEETKYKDEHKVRDILMDYLDQCYYEKVVGIEDPIGILNTVKESEQGSINTTAGDVNRRIQSTKYDP